MCTPIRPRAIKAEYKLFGGLSNFGLHHISCFDSSFFFYGNLFDRGVHGESQTLSRMSDTRTEIDSPMVLVRVS